jgi:hypothetical protein
MFNLLIKVATFVVCLNTLSANAASPVTREYLARMGINPNAANAALDKFDIHSRNPLFKNPNMIIIVDYTLPSYVERMFLVDLNSGNIESYLTTHGKNSGTEWVNKTANELVTPENPLGDNNSLRSSVGSFLTSSTKQSARTGWSRTIIGLDPDNQNTFVPRYIYIHGKDGVNLDYKKKNGFVVQSEGCFVVDTPFAKHVVDSIGKGTFMYVHWNRKELNDNMNKARAAVGK